MSSKQRWVGAVGWVLRIGDEEGLFGGEEVRSRVRVVDFLVREGGGRGEMENHRGKTRR
jgi:hypothetical protein